MSFGTLITYKNIVFKSRVEFAWAQEWEARELDWEYEPVTFRTGEGSYTPDFQICDRVSYVECKAWGARNIHNKFHLCVAPLFLIFGIPQRCYIRFKPAGALVFLPQRLTTFDAALALIRKAAA